MECGRAKVLNVSILTKKGNAPGSLGVAYRHTGEEAPMDRKFWRRYGTRRKDRLRFTNS